jgi:hypothetical protein
LPHLRLALPPQPKSLGGGSCFATDLRDIWQGGGEAAMRRGWRRWQCRLQPVATRRATVSGAQLRANTDEDLKWQDLCEAAMAGR